MNTIKQRITSGWNWIRIVYLIMGISIMIQSIMIRQWAAVLFGGWFTAMGLFGLGCASGSCYIPGRGHGTDSKNNLLTNETDPVNTGYEEIKGA
jgi:hypothetical protein